MMATPLLKGRREEMHPYMTCLLCHNLLQDCFTLPLCLHSFCRKCIYEKLSAGGVKSCPLCDVNLGHVSVAEIRPDHYLQDIRANVYPIKKRKIVALEVCSSSKGKERPFSSLVDTPVVSLPPATQEAATEGEIQALEWHKSCSLVVKKRGLEEFLGGSMTYHPRWSLTDEGAILLNMVCRLVQNAVQPKQSIQLMRKPVSDVFQWLKYHFNNEKPKLADKEDENLSNLRSELDAKLKQQAEFYEARLKEQTQQYEVRLKEQAKHYEAKLKSVRNEVIDQKKQLEQKDKEIEMLFQVTEELRESIVRLDEAGGEVKMVQKVQHDSHRAGMEEGVKRVVRAVQAAASYVKWDLIHISEDTPVEDRESLQRAFFEGIISAPSLLTHTQDQTHVFL